MKDFFKLKREMMTEQMMLTEINNDTSNIIIPGLKYCNSLTSYSRRVTREVFVGDVPLGGNNPIRVQSMTTTDTMDTLATVEQSIRMIEAGCEYVRITAPSINEAQNLQNIKNELRKRGYNTPLIADIHFTPNAAELAAKIVEKVRINPGNYADKKKFEIKEYTDAGYEAELERLRKRFIPLVKICKEYGTAMRIGTNHGSLSDRIMNRYGDTPQGMVESAMEFLRICGELDYHKIVLSMKSSNPIVMIQAYRMLVAQMDREEMNYPLHLGVTEAGEDEEGRVKSAMGIGTLLEDGIGDTIRVSLTEAPEFEIPVARTLVARYNNRSGHAPIKSALQKDATLSFNNNSNNSKPAEETEAAYSPFRYKRRATAEINNIGGGNVPRVIADFSGINEITELSLRAVDFFYDSITDKWNMSELGADYLYFGDNAPGFMLPTGTKGIYNFEKWLQLEDKENNFPLLTLTEFKNQETTPGKLFFLNVDTENLDEALLTKIGQNKNIVLVLSTNNDHAMAALRQVYFDVLALGIKNPVIINRKYEGLNEEEFILHSSTDAGGLLAEGFGDGIFLQYNPEKENKGNQASASPALIKLVNRTSFNILQASRTRISKTEYISCPSCGRTLFDLQETTAMIRKETDHLKGVKIAIMGCIVNGPGEMADADYGYVGTGPGKITLYKGKEVVKKNIESRFALTELINLIKVNGHWVEKQ